MRSAPQKQPIPAENKAKINHGSKIRQTLYVTTLVGWNGEAVLSSDDQKGPKVSTLKMYKAKVLALRNNLVPARWLSR